MAKTSKDARKHIKALSEFFADSRIVAEKLFDEFIKDYQRKKHLQQTLQRLINRNLVVKKEKKLIVTEKGSEFFKKYSKKRKFMKWDGKWYIVTFDVPVEFNDKRRILRNLLREYLFYPLQKSVWISPMQLTKKFWERVIKNNLENYCRIMSVNILDGDEELKDHFKNFIKF